MRRHRPVGSALLAVVATVGLAGTPAQGAQWRQPISLGTTDIFLGNPIVMTEDDGGALIARVGLFGDGVGYSVRLTGDSAFTQIRELVPSCPGCGQTNHRIAMNPSGTAIVAWQEYDSAAQVTTLKAAMIGPTGDRGPIESLAANVVDAAIDSSGRAFVVSTDGTGQPQVRTRAPAGGWSAPLTLAGPLESSDFETRDGFDSRVRFAVNGTQVAIALQLEDCTIAVSRLQPDATWTTSAPQSDPNCDRTPSVSIAPDGSVDLIWYSWRGTHDVVRTAAAPPGSGFGPSTDLGVAWVGSPSIRRVAAGTVASWVIPTNRTNPLTKMRAAVRTKVGTGPWGPVSYSGTMTDLRSATIGRDGTVVAVSTGTNRDAITTTRKPFGAAWQAAILSPTQFAYSQGGDPGMYANGELLVPVLGDGFDRTSFRVFDFTGRSQPPLTLPRPKLLRMVAPREVNAGAQADFLITADRYGMPIPLQIQQLRSGRWVTLMRRSIALNASDAVVDVRVRPLGTGVVKLRVVGGTPTRTLGPVSLTVRSVLRKRFPVGTTAYKIQAGGAGVWVAEGSWFYPPNDLARRLSPIDGHTLRTVRTTGQLLDLAVGDSATWLVDSGSQLTRISGATGATTSTSIRGWVRSVSAQGGSVWIGGVCPSNPVPQGADCATRRRAVRVNATNGQPTVVHADLAPTGHADRVVVTGGITWMAGEYPADVNNKFTLGTVTTATGARRSSPSVWNGVGTPVWPLTDTIAWRRQDTFRQIRPTLGNLIAPLGGFNAAAIVDVARNGKFLWTLEQSATFPTREKLVQRTLTGVRTGKTIDLGKTYSTTMSIYKNVAWILQPSEATVIRVPLPTS